MNATPIGALCKRSPVKRDHIQVAKLLDYIDVHTQEMIMTWHKEGVTKRQMTANLIELGIPSPPTKCPWSETCFRAVINKYNKV